MISAKPLRAHPLPTYKMHSPLENLTEKDCHLQQ